MGEMIGLREMHGQRQVRTPRLRFLLMRAAPAQSRLAHLFLNILASNLAQQGRCAAAERNYRLSGLYLF